VGEFASVGDRVKEVLKGDPGAPFVVGGVEAEKGRQAEGLSEKKGTPQL
jgi:hypothetical protein